MKYIVTILKKIFTKEVPNPVGRWRTENCNKQMNHFGPCGQYALTKKITEEKKPNNSFFK